MDDSDAEPMEHLERVTQLLSEGPDRKGIRSGKVPERRNKNIKALVFPRIEVHLHRVTNPSPVLPNVTRVPLHNRQ